MRYDLIESTSRGIGEGREEDRKREMEIHKERRKKANLGIEGKEKKESGEKEEEMEGLSGKKKGNEESEAMFAAAGLECCRES